MPGAKGRPSFKWRSLIVLLAALFCAALASVTPASAHDAAAPATSASAASATSPGNPTTNPPGTSTANQAMGAAGWFEIIAMKLESEAVSDITMLPDAPSALAREWRSFDANGSSLGALINVGWVALMACLCLVAERGVSQGLSRRARRRMRSEPGRPSLSCLMTALLCDLAGVVVFAALFIYSRHGLLQMGVPLTVMLLGAYVLLRWRLAMLVVRVLLRPNVSVARPIDLSDIESRRLMRFMSATILAVTILIAFGRYGLADEDSGAPHLIGLLVAASICALYTIAVFRARVVAEALIRGHSTGIFGALRGAVARVWIPIGLLGVAFLFVSFVFGLSLGLLSYYRAVASTLAVLLVLLVLEQLTSHGSSETAPAPAAPANQAEILVGHSLRRIFRAIVLLVATMITASIWVEALELPAAEESHAMQSTVIAVLTVFVAYILWELARMAIDRSLPDAATGPRLPSADEEEETGPGSRLQTILPMLRAGFGIVIAVVAALTVLSRLGIDTGPLIAGAGVFGLAISFGSQSLVRDIISGLFYIWDDGFRVGEYIDTGRLRGTVEALGVRSMKLRHHNGPLHTIPYGQLTAVTNLSRDFATIKFNLRLEPGTDVELVRKTAKRIGIEMQDDPEIAAEVILPLKMQGIAEIVDNAVILRFKFTARPVKPTYIQRLYLKRMYTVFAEKGIHFAVGALTLQTAANRLDMEHPGPSGVVFPDPLRTATPAPAARVA